MLNVSDPICAKSPVETPSRPYLIQVFAVSGWRLGTQEYSYVVTRSRPYLAKIFPPPATRGCHPPPETVLSHLCTFAQEHRSDLHLCTVSLLPSCTPALRYSRSSAPSSPQNGDSSTNPTRILPLGSFVKCRVRCGPSFSGLMVIWLGRNTFLPSRRQTLGSGWLI